MALQNHSLEELQAEIKRRLAAPETASTAAATSVYSAQTKVGNFAASVADSYVSTVYAASSVGSTMEERKQQLILAAQAKAMSEVPTVKHDEDVDIESDNSIAAGKLGASTNTSKKTKARNSRDRGPVRRARDERKLAAYLTLQGKQYDKDAAQKRVEASTGVKGSMAREVQRFIKMSMDDAKQLQTPEQHMEQVAKLITPGSPICGAVRNEVIAEGLLLQTLSKFVQFVPEKQDSFCFLCRKTATQGHLDSAGHAEMLMWSASLSWMCFGTPSMMRAPHQGAPLPPSGIMTQKQMEAWWGPGVGNMRAQAQRIFDNPALLGVRFASKNGSIFIEKSQLMLGDVMAVPYIAGEGMYVRASEKTRHRIEAMPFVMLPEGVFSPDNEDLARFEELACDKGAQDPLVSVMGKTYWPIIRWCPSERASAEVVSLLQASCQASCIVQWLEALAEVVAWAVWQAGYFAD